MTFADVRPKWQQMGYPDPFGADCHAYARLSCGCSVFMSPDKTPELGQGVFHYGKCSPVTGGVGNIQMLKQWRRA